MEAIGLYIVAFIALLVTVNGDLPKESEVQKFSRNDLFGMFGIDNQADVPDYEFINLDKLINHQRKKNNGSVCFKAFNKRFCVTFLPDKKLPGRRHVIEYHHGNGTVEKYTNILKPSTLATVNNERKSHATFHDSGRGVSGHIKVSNKLYFVNYLPHGLRSTKSNHVIFRRRRDTSSEVDDSELHDVESDSVETKKKSVAAGIRDLLPEKFMELMIAADYTMAARYDPLVLNGYMVTMANIVHGFYHDPSLSYPITVALVKLVIFKTNKFKAKTVHNLLGKFASWCAKNRPKGDDNPEHWDNAVLLTRNGCENGCKIEGLAKRVMCSPFSVAVVKDRGLMASTSIAHEIGHNLYLGHDGGDSGCKDAVNLMATGPEFGKEIESWSKCSSKAMERSLKSPNSKCYDDKPVEKSHIQFHLYGRIYDATQQCKFINGEVFTKCIHKQSCETLFCSSKDSMNVCISLSYPPIDGTLCAPNMWCIHGSCVPDGTTPTPPVNGGWSSWSSAYTPCTVTCGIGDQWKTRECNNPKPDYGGSACKGITRKYYRTCGTGQCPGNAHISRLEQCKKINPKHRDIYYKGDQPCQLFCAFTSKDNPRWFHGVIDGTRCGNSRDNPNFLKLKPAICVAGNCERIGCDSILHSGEVLDRCGVCAGDGTTCQFYTGKDTTPYNDMQRKFFITKIPAGAFKIKVKEMGKTYLGFLGFKIGKSTRLAVNLPSMGTIIDLKGTKIRYNMQNYVYADSITAVGKISKSISIYYYPYFGTQSTSKGITWSYYGPVNGTAKVPTLEWEAKKWSHCSSVCAGGTKTRVLICKRKDDGTQVGKKHCNQATKPLSMTACAKQDCDPEWYITKWGSCSRNCGNGNKKRKILCSSITISNRKTVPEKLCSKPKPTVPIVKHCHSKMCPAKWHVVSDFSKCTSSCGGGIRYRKIECKHVGPHGEIEATNPVECILRKKPVQIQRCNQKECPPK